MTGTAVTTKAPSEVAARIEATKNEMKARNAMVAAIRGQMWSKEMSDEQMRALAHYCNTNGLDPVRHVEVLGGRPYLTAGFYEERGASLVQSGVVVIEEPRYINADPRLDKLADGGDAWAIEEREARMRERILRNAPEEAKSIAVYTLRVASSGKTIVGVNWCGGLGKRDPVGEAEPSKTSATRAGRRAWKQLVEVIPEYGVAIKHIEANAKLVGEEIVGLAEPVETKRLPTPLRAPASEDLYENENTVAVEVEP